ncbi:MAG: lactate racemase domain-containing protein [Nitrospiraceae bacterium]
MAATLRVVPHDCHGELADLGTSPAGLPVKINRLFMECDLKIGIGCLYPHPFAGLSGGAKLVVPGLCGAETTRMMHDYVRGARARGGSIHTEVRRDMVAIARRAGLEFIVNVTLNRHRAISGLFAGDVEQAFESGVQAARQLYRVASPPRADVVVADMYPFDGSWQFAQDRGLWPLERTGAGTSKVVIAACPQGVGNHELFPVASPLWSRLARRLRHLGPSDLSRPVEKIQTILALMRRKREPLLVMAPGLQANDVTRIFPRARWFRESGTIWRRCSRGPRRGDRRTVAVYRCAPLLLADGSDRAEASAAVDFSRPLRPIKRKGEGVEHESRHLAGARSHLRYALMFAPYLLRGRFRRISTNPGYLHAPDMQVAVPASGPAARS